MNLRIQYGNISEEFVFHKPRCIACCPLHLHKSSFSHMSFQQSMFYSCMYYCLQNFYREEICIACKIEWSNEVLSPNQDSFTYAEVLHFGIVEETRVTGNKPLTFKLETDNFFTLRTAPNGIGTMPYRCAL